MIDVGHMRFVSVRDMSGELWVTHVGYWRHEEIK